MCFLQWSSAGTRNHDLCQDCDFAFDVQYTLVGEVVHYESWCNLPLDDTRRLGAAPFLALPGLPGADPGDRRAGSMRRSHTQFGLAQAHVHHTTLWP